MRYDDNYAIFNVKDLFEFVLVICYQNFQLMFKTRSSLNARFKLTIKFLIEPQLLPELRDYVE